MLECWSNLGLRRLQKCYTGGSTCFGAEVIPAKFRITFMLNKVDENTVPVTWPIPRVESELADVAGNTCFASIEFCSGYCQMQAHEDTQPFQSFITPKGVYQSKRPLRGLQNSMANFQSRVEPCFAEIRDELKAWLEDFLLHREDEAKLLQLLEIFLSICRARNLKVSITNSVFFTTVIRW